MIETAVRGPHWRGAAEVFRERSNFQAQLKQEENQRKAGERERSRVADYLRQHKDLNRADVRFPIENLKSAVHYTQPHPTINVFA